MTTKAELAARLTAININLPENWAKLSLARATAFVENSEAPAKPKRKTLAQGIGAIAGAVVGGVMASFNQHVPEPEIKAGKIRMDLPELDGMKGYDESSRLKATGQTKAATMPKDPKWKRQGSDRLRPGQWYPGRAKPVDLATASRQVKRALLRREDKMPIGANQSLWHKAQGFGAIGGRI